MRKKGKRAFDKMSDMKRIANYNGIRGRYLFS